MGFEELNFIMAERVMGWEFKDGHWFAFDGQRSTSVSYGFWSPGNCVDDALMGLEKVACKRRWEIKSYEKFDNDTQTYFYVRLVNHTSGPKIKRTKANHEKLSVAICLCALRACGVKEDEISKALAAAS